MKTMYGPPERHEAAPYYFKYIDRVSGGDILSVLAQQQRDMPGWLLEISEEKSLHRYAPGKWSIRELLSHINDTERVLVSRAFWFARKFDSPLPSFDENVCASATGAHEISWINHVEEFEAVRSSTMALFRNLPAEAWTRNGIASDNLFTVRALAYIIAGHAEHHAEILRQRYLMAG